MVGNAETWKRRDAETWKRRDAEDAEKRASKESLYGFRISAVSNKRHGRAGIQRDSGCCRIAHGHLPRR